MLSQPFENNVYLSIVVPALNEAANLPELVRQIDSAIGEASYEVLIVDDGSTDETVDVCAKLSETFPVKLHVRPEPVGGLSGAVIEGFRRSRGELLVVMDADLQHPPARIPALLEALHEGGVEVAVGSRYVTGGSTGSKWGLARWINSKVATLLARPFTGGTRDPMSGFFALRRETLERAQSLTPMGYKIGLEVLCKCRVKRVAEVPIHFAERERGESKLTVKQQVKYLEHLSRLYDFCFPHGSPVAKFLIASACAWFVGLGVYFAFLKADFKPMPAAALSYPTVLVVTAIFHGRYLRNHRDGMTAKWPWRDFAVVSLAEWAACALAALWIAGRARDIRTLEVFVVTYAAATAARYVLHKELLHDIRGLRRRQIIADAEANAERNAIFTRSQEIESGKRRAA